MPVYASRHQRLVVGDVAFEPHARDEDHEAVEAAVRALYADDPGAGVAYGCSYDERLAGVEAAGDLVVVETAEEREAAKKPARKPSSR